MTTKILKNEIFATRFQLQTIAFFRTGTYPISSKFTWQFSPRFYRFFQVRWDLISTESDLILQSNLSHSIIKREWVRVKHCFILIVNAVVLFCIFRTLKKVDYNPLRGDFFYKEKMNDLTRSRCEYLLRNNRLVNDWNTVVEQLLLQNQPKTVKKKRKKKNNQEKVKSQHILLLEQKLNGAYDKYLSSGSLSGAIFKGGNVLPLQSGPF